MSAHDFYKLAYYITLQCKTSLLTAYVLQVFGEVVSTAGTGGAVVAKVAVNTTVSAAAAALVTLLIGLQRERRMDPVNASNGLLAGLLTPNKRF